MEVANAEVKLLEERLHATEKGGPSARPTVESMCARNSLTGLSDLVGWVQCGRVAVRARRAGVALKDIATQSDDVRKRLAEKVRPPTVGTVALSAITSDVPLL